MICKRYVFGPFVVGNSWELLLRDNFLDIPTSYNSQQAPSYSFQLQKRFYIYSSNVYSSNSCKHLQSAVNLLSASALDIVLSAWEFRGSQMKIAQHTLVGDKIEALKEGTNPEDPQNLVIALEMWTMYTISTSWMNNMPPRIWWSESCASTGQQLLI